MIIYNAHTKTSTQNSAGLERSGVLGQIYIFYIDTT